MKVWGGDQEPKHTKTEGAKTGPGRRTGGEAREKAAATLPRPFKACREPSETLGGNSLGVSLSGLRFGQQLQQLAERLLA